MHLISDGHSVQSSDTIQTILEKCNTEVTFVSSGCTSLVQPIDVGFNKPFKSATAYMQIMDAYAELGCICYRGDECEQAMTTHHQYG